MNLTTEEKLVQYLEQREHEFIKTWQETILLEDKDIHKNEIVKRNGMAMYELLKKLLLNSVSEELMKELAYKVAEDRVLISRNIGELVFNVNVGRRLVLSYFMNSGLSLSELKPVIERVNLHADQFCYHAVTRYAEIKDRELKKKMVFVNQSHQDRLTLLGQMSSSFVHEFRNPLTAVMGFMKLLKLENPSLKYMETIEHELDQLNFRITQFLHVSRLENVVNHPEEIRIEELLNEILSFLYPSIVDADVEINTEIDPACMIFAVKDEIKQVLVNIILNSIDAIKEQSAKGVISIKSDKKDDVIIFSITNNGPKIPDERREAIFEPFYTTKRIGTGIGLYVCKTIIEKHNGTILCESNDKFTSFIIRLPIADRKS